LPASCPSGVARGRIPVRAVVAEDSLREKKYRIAREQLPGGTRSDCPRTPASRPPDDSVSRNHAETLDAAMASPLLLASVILSGANLMEPTDLTIEILKDIRAEVRQTNGRLDLTIGRLDQTIGRLDQTNERLDTVVDRVERLERRQTESEVRLTTEIVAVAAAVLEVRDLLRDDRGLRATVDDHERRLSAVERRAG
jgi:hypothetical protein